MIAVSFYSYFRPWREGRLDMPSFVHEAKRVGADGVELLFYGYRSPEGPDLEREQVRDGIRAALADTGLVCPIFSVSNDFTKPDRAEELAKVRFGLEEARALGAGIVRVFAGDLKDGLSFEAARAGIVDGLAEASRMAADFEIRLALENHGRLAGKPDQVRGLIEDVRERAGSDALWANPDFANFLLVGADPAAAVAEVGDLAAMAHAKDFKRVEDSYDGWVYRADDGQAFTGVALGEGDSAVAACVAALVGHPDAMERGDVVFSIEWEGDRDPYQAVPEGVATLRRFGL